MTNSKTGDEDFTKSETLRVLEQGDQKMVAAKNLPQSAVDQAIAQARESLARLESSPRRDPLPTTSWLQFFA